MRATLPQILCQHMVPCIGFQMSVQLITPWYVSWWSVVLTQCQGGFSFSHSPARGWECTRSWEGQNQDSWPELDQEVTVSDWTIKKKEGQVLDWWRLSSQRTTMRAEPCCPGRVWTPDCWWEVASESPDCALLLCARLPLNRSSQPGIQALLPPPWSRFTSSLQTVNKWPCRADLIV